MDAGFAEEEGEDGDELGDWGGEDFGAHADEAAEFRGGEVEGGEQEVDGGFDGGKRDGEDRRVVVDEGEEVEADGVEVEDFFLEVGVRGWGGRGF